MRIQFPIFITFIVGMITLLDFFLPFPTIKQTAKALGNWAIILGGVAIILGVLNIISVQYKKIRKRGEEWYNGVVMIFFLMAVAVPSFIWGDKNVITDFLFDYVITPLNSTIFSLLAFFMASAAFRAFRARSVEASVLLLVAIIVMVARVPYFQDIMPPVVSLADWLSAYPAMAAIRGIMIGAALGIISTSIRILLGIDRSYLGSTP